MSVPPPNPPDSLSDLWLPIGPTTVIGSDTFDSLNTTGRVRHFAVSPNGKRVYAATAGGGVWYSNDEGASWMSLGGWLTTPDVANYDYFGNALATGCVAVNWDPSDTGEDDTVYVGTGEISPARTGQPGGKLAGIGVLRSQAPAPIARANPFAPTWNRDADAMAGAGVYRLAINPKNKDMVAAATSIGLYVRSVASGVTTWTKVTADPFDKDLTVTDAWWAPPVGPPTNPAKLWVAVQSLGVWVSDTGTSGFTKVDLPQRKDGRLGLGGSEDGEVIYVIGVGPRLWRVTGTAAKLVENVPAGLFGGGSMGAGKEEEDEEEREAAERAAAAPERPAANAGGQAYYDMTVAVHPTDPNTVVIGGAAVEAISAALFKCTVQDPTGHPSLNYQTVHDAANDSPSKDGTFIGYGVHADVHHAAFARRDGKLDLWVSSDGGITRSAAAGRSFTWQERNSGLAAIEPGFIACHPTSDAVVIVGTQDNGVLERTSDTTWTYKLGGDAGGVAFHPGSPDRYLAQETGGKWRSSDAKTTSPVFRSNVVMDHETEEHKKTRFYQAPGVVAATNAAGVRVAVGTNRVWVSEDFGATWYTVKTGNDPRAGARHDTGQDVFYDDARAKVLACRWKDENELYVLSERSVQRFTRSPGPVTWDRAVVTDHKNKSSAYTESDIDGKKMKYLPPYGDWSDLALHLPGPNGSTTLYVSCCGYNSRPKMDTLWWFDGAKTWYATGLRSKVKAPALSVQVHPIDNTIVFVGTTVGVYKGTFSHPAGADPSWTFTEFSKGLPEAAVQDLAFYREPRTGPPTMLLLRAALQSRGAWEVDLLAPCDQKTFLRVHPHDTRRRAVTVLQNPTRPAGVEHRYFDSPDITIRPMPPVSPATMPAMPVFPFFPIAKDSNSWGFDLWTFQTAFHKLVPTCPPTGRWTTTFETLLVDYKSGNGLGKTPVIDRDTWQEVVKQPRVYQPPWDGPGPTEAELSQLTLGELYTITPTRFHTRRFNVDVLVHHRALQQLQPPSVSVLLLVRKMTELLDDWPAVPIGALWKTATVSALTTGTAPAGGWPDRWVIADPAVVRHPAGNVDASRPQAATFDLIFPPATANGEYVLLAACSSVTAQVTAARLGGGTLGDLLLNSSHVAAHRLVLQ